MRDIWLYDWFYGEIRDMYFSPTDFIVLMTKSCELIWLSRKPCPTKLVGHVLAAKIIYFYGGSTVFLTLILMVSKLFEVECHFASFWRHPAASSLCHRTSLWILKPPSSSQWWNHPFSEIPGHLVMWNWRGQTMMNGASHRYVLIRFPNSQVWSCPYPHEILMKYLWGVACIPFFAFWITCVLVEYLLSLCCANPNFYNWTSMFDVHWSMQWCNERVPLSV